ncbi:hypothetical protein M9434_002272 [Picochlorum sp. BPE23]|nr:hypothetical protein M9434_002272 [Picochlorum sp. BPE23]
MDAMKDQDDVKRLVGGLKGLGNVLVALAASVSEISDSLRRVASTDDEVGTLNQFGDKQLLADVMADKVIRETLLRLCPDDVGIVSSEETPVDTVLTDATGYSVAYDPLDGSSIIGSNFAVGSIFGIWKGRGFVGKNARDMAAAGYAVYGPRTVLVLAFEDDSEDSGKTVCEFTLAGDGVWKCTEKNIVLKDEKKLFAPANLRASKENSAYAELMQHWMQEQYTLRYTGGMVPDIHNIIHKGGGVFCNPISASCPAKLRLLYECHPFTFIIEAAGGMSIDDTGAAGDRRVQHHDDRSCICLGSSSEVRKCTPCMSSC